MSKLITTATTLFKIKRVSTTIIIVTAIISAIIGFVTFYATQVGNFVISATNKEFKLFLSETVGFENPSTVLTAKGVNDIDNTTYKRIDFGAIAEVDGSKNSFQYLGYNFYVGNMSEEMVNYNVKLSIDKVYKAVDKAMWVRVIETRYDEKTGKPVVNDKIYAAPVTGSTTREPEKALENPDRGGVVPVTFLSDITIFDYDVRNLRAGEMVHYTIVLWLEGWDNDCVDEIMMGTIRLSLNFQAF